MAEITHITFTRKVNTGNFESFDISATAQIAEGDHPGAIAAYVQSFVDSAIQERLDKVRRPGARGGLDVGEVEF